MFNGVMFGGLFDDAKAALTGYGRQAAEPIIQDAESRVRAEAKRAAAEGAREAVLPWIAASMGLSVLAIGITIWRTRRK